MRLLTVLLGKYGVRDNMNREVTVEKRTAYFIQDTVKTTSGEFIPCIAVEGEKGYNRTNWSWGKDKALAERCAKEKNERLGHTVEDVSTIVCSTMGLS